MSLQTDGYINNDNTETGTGMYNYTFSNIRDFDPVHTFECGQCFRWVPDGEEDGAYIGAAGAYAARLTFRDDMINLDTAGGSEGFWRRYLDLDTDYSGIKAGLTAREPAIEAAVEYGAGIRILNQELFETIISFIISQNNNIPRIRKNIEALCAAYGERIGSLWGREWYSFPTPEALAEADTEELKALKLGYRADYITAAGKHFCEDAAKGRLPSSREDILSYLGIGPKVANCIMLFGLRCTEAFPVDTWVKHIMNDMYGFEENDVKGMTAFAAEKFGSRAGYAQQYLFYYYRDRERQ